MVGSKHGKTEAIRGSLGGGGKSSILNKVVREGLDISVKT